MKQVSVVYIVGCTSLENCFQTNSRIMHFRDAALAQWIHLRLPSCHPAFASNYAFINLLNCVMWKNTKINKKKPQLAHLKKYAHE